MATIGWGDVSKKNNTPKNYNKGEGSADLFIKLSEGKHTVRLVGAPHAIDIAWIHNSETDKDEKFIVPTKGGYHQRLVSLGVKITSSFAVNAFYIGDDKVRLRILEKGISVFDGFGAWHENFTYPEGHAHAGEKIDPGGVDGPNFVIVSEVPVGKKASQRASYKVVALQQTPFTKDQIELLKRGRKENAEKYKDLPLGERGAINLKEYYSEERAAERLDKKLKELAGINVGNESEDAPINKEKEDVSEDSFEVSNISDIIGNTEDSQASKPQTKTQTKSQPKTDLDLVKEAEEVLGDLF